jgi:2-dehydropantoate 2-reductase
MRIAVVGAGSLGIVIGGLLARAGRPGRDIELVAARQEAADALNSQGAVLQGSLEAVIPVKAVTPQGMRGVYDCAILITKLDASARALAELAPHLGAESLVCTLQNGMPEDAVAAAVGAGRTVGGVVLMGAARQGLNVSRITSTAETLAHAFEIGELDGSLTPRIEALRGVLADVGGCHVVANLLDLRWAKLLVNTAVGAMTAMLGCDNLAVLESDQALGLVVRAADETIRVAHAAGRRLAPLHGRDMEALAVPPGGRPEDRFALFREYYSPWGRTRSSMYQDLAAGRRTEVRHLNGYVSARGRELGVPTPVNDVVVRLVVEAEARGQAPEFAANLARALELLAAG